MSCFEVEKEVLDRIADSGSPQGILAVATVKETEFLLVHLEKTHSFLHFIEQCKLMKKL